MKKMLFPLVLSGLVLSAACHAGAYEPTLTISFDGDFDGVAASGRKIKGIVRGKPALVDGGISGKALLSGPTHGYLDYPVRDLLSPAEGTIEMWVKGLDWEWQDNKFHVFAECKGPGGWLLVYKYYRGVALTALTAANPDGRLNSAGVPYPGWKKGQWHHLAMTWGKDGIKSYVNGHSMDIYPISGPLPRKLADLIAIGDRPWQFERTSSTKPVCFRFSRGWKRENWRYS